MLSTDNPQFARLRSQCLSWSEDHAAELTDADPYLPKALDDRAADNWRPLKAIADVLGDRWAKLCWDAAEVLSRERGEDETTGVALLLALKAIFAEHAAEIFDRQGKPAGKAMHTETSCRSCTTPTPAGRNTDARRSRSPIAVSPGC